MFLFFLPLTCFRVAEIIDAQQLVVSSCQQTVTVLRGEAEVFWVARTVLEISQLISSIIKNIQDIYWNNQFHMHIILTLHPTADTALTWVKLTVLTMCLCASVRTSSPLTASHTFLKEHRGLVSIHHSFCSCSDSIIFSFAYMFFESRLCSRIFL